MAIEVELQRFDADANQAVLTGLAAIMPSGLPRELHSLSTQAATNGPAAGDTVQAMRTALGSNADRIAEAVAQTGPTAAP